MCMGGSKSTSAPPPSQPTTFGYGAADNSNVAKAKAAAVGSTKGGETALTGNDGPASSNAAANSTTLGTM